jgi:hypothetical protein
MSNIDHTSREHEEEVKGNEEAPDRPANPRDTARIEANDFFDSMANSRGKVGDIIGGDETAEAGNNGRLLECKNMCIDMFRKLYETFDLILRRLIDDEIIRISDELLDVNVDIVAIERVRSDCDTVIKSKGVTGFYNRLTLQKRSAREKRKGNSKESTELRNRRLELWKTRSDIESGKFDGHEELEKLLRMKNVWSSNINKINAESDIDIHFLRKLFFSFSKSLKGYCNENEINELINNQEFQDAFEKAIDFLGLDSVVTSIRKQPT